MRRGIPPRRPFRPGRGAIRGRYISQSSSRNLRATINLSDSDYDYESSDDIKVIKVQAATHNNKPLLLSDSDDYDVSNSGSTPLLNVRKQNIYQEADWRSKKTPPEIKKKRIEKEDHLREQSKPFNLSNYSEETYSDSIQEEPNPNIKQEERENVESFNVNIKTPNKNSNKLVRNTKKQNNENQKILKTNIPVDRSNFNEADNSSIPIGKPDNNDSNINNDDNKASINENDSHQNHPDIPIPDPIENIDSNPLQSFIVARKGKKFSKISFELLENNVAVLKSSSKKEGKKSIHLIYRENILGDNVSSLPIYIGYVRSRKKKRFYTFYTTAKKDERDDREGELLCIYFNSNNNSQDSSNSTSGSLDTSKSPTTVIIPKFQVPNYPITQRLTLENFAYSNSIDQSKFIKLVGTEITSQVESEFGSSFYTKSGKNCVLIEPNSNKIVFILLKSTYDIFNMKVRPPLTKEQGFALAVALIKHDQ